MEIVYLSDYRCETGSFKEVPHLYLKSEDPYVSIEELAEILKPYLDKLTRKRGRKVGKNLDRR